MSTTADLLNKLVSQKNTLADNLVEKGVEATHDETLKTLVPKVLDISSGSVAKSMSFDKWEHRTGTMPGFGYTFDKDGWAGPFSGYSYIAIDKLFTYEKSFEIMFNFKLDSVPTTSNAMIGSSIRDEFYKCPTIELQASKIWCAVSYDGYSWKKTVSSNITWEPNREYYVRYSYNNNSKTLKLELSYDGNNWETLSTTEDVEIGYQCVGTEYLELGGIAQSGRHEFNCGKINLFKSYIKIDDELFWGIEYN